MRSIALSAMAVARQASAAGAEAFSRARGDLALNAVARVPNISVAFTASISMGTQTISTSVDLLGQLSLGSGRLARMEAGLLNAGLIPHL
jgi:hypothetical protein